MLPLCIPEHQLPVALLHRPYREGTNVACLCLEHTLTQQSCRTHAHKCCHLGANQVQVTHLWREYTCQHLKLKTRVNTNKKILQGILAKKIGPLPTWLAVLLIPRIHNPYKLYLVVKVTNQAFQRYKIQYQLVLLKGRNKRQK